ncbi:MAG TPA: ATP-binding protein, partial [Candidatus Manganitrophaceae bacterium]|nr:ATP-binding protein [Candidatus Manganitrophaceae bacterium]
RRMGELIEDLLNLSRVSRSEMRREPVDLTLLAQSIAEELQRSEPKREATFLIEDNLTVSADARLLKIVLENLMGNAWKFTSKHPTATIELGMIEHRERKVNFIRDNGAGFDMAYVDKLFGPFKRLHSLSEFQGTGVGLATVQRIIHRHGGEIWAEGAVEGGATFYFTI